MKKNTDTDAYTLEKIINTNKHKLYIKGRYKNHIYESLKNIIPDFFYEDCDENLIFLATTVVNLALFKEQQKNKKDENVLHIINWLTIQIERLRINSNLIFYGLDLNDILVINNNIFIIVNSNNLIEMNENINNNSKITFFSPFELPYFSSPEMLNITSLPAEIDYRVSYYSLGALIIYYLTNKYLFLGNEVMREKDIENCLLPFLNTKVYWFLKRCIKSDCEKRILLFI
jgi:hypothetical protein